MLTPTGVTSASYNAAIKAGNATHVRLTFTGQNIVFDDSDIDSGAGLVLSNFLNGEGDLTFGRAAMRKIEVGIIKSSKTDNLFWSDNIKLEMGVDIGGTTYYVTLGYFIGEKPELSIAQKIVSFTANDKMSLFDVPVDDFWSSLTYPKTVTQIYQALCNYIGVGYTSGNELANIMSRSYSAAPANISGYTCRDLLAWIAEAAGCYARINAAGNCQLVWYTDCTSYVVTGDDEFAVDASDIGEGYTWDEFDQLTWDQADTLVWDRVCGYREAGRINSICVKHAGNDVDINYPLKATENVYMIVDNPFLSVGTSSDITNYIAPIYNRLDAFGGRLAVTVECVGNWLVEAGDIITVTVDDTTVATPIYCKTMKYAGGCKDTYELTGGSNREALNEDNRQKLLEQSRIRLFVGDSYYGKQSGIEITASGIDVSGNDTVDIESGSKIRIKSGSILEVQSGGDMNIESGGDVNVKSGGNFTISSGGTLGNSGTLDINSGGSANVKSGGNLNIDSSGNLNVNSGGTAKIKSGGTMDVDSGGNMNINSGGSLNIKASGVLSVKSSGAADIESGGNLNIKSGSNLNIKSSGTANVESGGLFKVKSGGDIDIESGGDVNVKSGGNLKIQSGGTADIESGANMNVKSGGNLKVNSGGALTVQSGGAMTIQSGGSISVNSGGTFNVTATNFSISSANKSMVTGNWSFFENGMWYEKSGRRYIIGENTDGVSINAGIYMEDNGSGGGWVKLLAAYNSNKVLGSVIVDTVYDVDRYNDENELVIAGRNTVMGCIRPPVDAEGYCGEPNHIWKYVYTETVFNYFQWMPSSREIKRDIKTLDSVGETLDKLQPVSFIYNHDKRNTKRYGLIYEDTKGILPELCIDTGKKGINYIDLVPMLLKEIQDLRKRVAKLETEVQ